MQAERGTQPGVSRTEVGDGLPVGFSRAVHHAAQHAEAREFCEEGRAERREPGIVKMVMRVVEHGSD